MTGGRNDVTITSELAREFAAEFRYTIGIDESTNTLCLMTLSIEDLDYAVYWLAKGSYVESDSPECHSATAQILIMRDQVTHLGHGAYRLGRVHISDPENFRKTRE